MEDPNLGTEESIRRQKLVIEDNSNSNEDITESEECKDLATQSDLNLSEAGSTFSVLKKIVGSSRKRKRPNPKNAPIKKGIPKPVKINGERKSKKLNCTSSEDLKLVKFIWEKKTRNKKVIIIELHKKHCFSSLDPEKKKDLQKLDYRIKKLED